jgi:FlaG/FlaF family flagellin (archaellin)
MRKMTALIMAAIVVAIAGCGSSSSSSSGSATTSSSSAGATTAAAGVNPNQRETLPPGDIPDTIAYVPYTVSGLGLTVSTPEGWSRSNAAGAVKFTDKLNEIQVFTVPVSAPPTLASAKSAEVPKLASSVKGFKLQSISTVSRPAGSAVRIDYLGDSKPDAVTGKVGTLAFERYDFFHKGKEVVLLLSSPNGSDNVDPWKKVTSSLRFTK